MLSRLVTIIAGESATLQCKASVCSVIFSVCTQSRDKAELETRPATAPAQVMPVLPVAVARMSSLGETSVSVDGRDLHSSSFQLNLSRY